METSSPYRPRVSRETRLLLIAGVLAVAALWLLARIRFPERDVSPNPLPSVLSQLASGPKYDDLAGEIAQLQARVQPSLLAIDVPSALLGALQTSHRTAAIRLRDDLAVMWVPSGSNQDPWNDATILARDAASGLAVMRLPIPVPTSSSPPVPWTPRQPQQRSPTAARGRWRYDEDGRASRIAVNESVPRILSNRSGRRCSACGLRVRRAHRDRFCVG